MPHHRRALSYVSSYTKAPRPAGSQSMASGLVYSSVTVSKVGSKRPTLHWLQIHRLGDDLFHDLRGAATDGEEAYVAEGARDVVLFHVPSAAVDLHALVRDALSEIPGEELRHRDLLHRSFAAV